jgi:regulatory protein
VRELIITQISKRKNKNRVYVDGEYAFSLVDSDIAYFGLKEGGEIDRAKYDFITGTTLYIKAQERALKYLSYRQRSAFEIRGKLLSEDFSADIIEKVIGFLKDYGYVDDLKYSVSYINDCLNFNPKGKRLIEWELKNRGIDRDDISKALCEVSFDELFYAKRLLAKKYGKLQKEDMSEGKMYQYLSRRGYDFETIKEAVSEFTE